MSTLSSDLADLLALHQIDGLGPQRISALLAHFETAARVLRASSDELLRVPGIGKQLASSIAAALPTVDGRAELQRLERANVRVLRRGAADFPACMADLPGSPLLLFCRGELLPSDARAVALVGTRHPNPYGKRVARQLAEGLARAGVTVVSGLARGIDGIAHRAALDAGGRTLAVLAGGLSRIYPPEHTDLADQITRSGALLTEATFLQDPSPWRFPARNRIISGLSKLVVIVQAPASSGALLTAEHAAEQGRQVLAVPGAIDDETQAGCHRLLREGAILCRGVEDILEELDGVSACAMRSAERSPTVTTACAPAPKPELTGTDQQIWEALAQGPLAIDLLAQRLDQPISQLSGALLGLELRRLVRRLPGNRFERV
jgi:DNA processing protein